MSSHPLAPRRLAALAALTAIAAGAAACGPKSEDAGADATPHQGGTLTILNQTPQTKFDPAREYTTGGGNIPGLVFRSLTTRARKAGAAGTAVVPDLATDIGEPSQGATVWTYHLKAGLKFEDGTPITSADIKYGVERSFAPQLSGGAPYLRDWLTGASGYQGPYKDPKGLSAITTPDARTVVFHLNKPEGDFPYLATQTQFTPVPKAKDTGTKYQDHPVSSGPYEVVSNQNDGTTLTLKRNPYWSQKSDAQRHAYPDRIVVDSGLDPAVIDQRLATGSGADADAVTTDTNLGPAELAKVNGDKELASRVGTGHFGFTNYLAFNPKVKPFDNQKVREAIAYAINRTSVVNAAGGSSLAEPATTFLPNQATFGYTPYDPFPAGRSGNAAKAKALLAQAGYPHGLTVTLTASTSDANQDGPAVAAAVQDGLKAAGITVKLVGLEDDKYQQDIYSVASEPGMFLSGWGADWPSGGPFLAPIFDGRQIVKDGYNFNSAQLNDPSVNAEIDRINKITDHAAAAKLWGKLDQRIGTKALTVPLFHPVYKRLYGKNVRNVVISDWTGVLDVSQVAVK
ncbi:ABC transporter substrate-binding protein [Streptomyces sp. SL13]|uniref:ABC transporter substrate-binding protein n=1 Tax=Streptantibioticus silvisoli TaxID=2705255 RepID=A0AA90H8T3_9ACTN|nr:ABC transporter substrate-binding protein [Streptantibioticus silvisoli]MDI5965583.1 ABC transporter substrate-binding protein [Streptantibioticus silvisoli]MDI5972604.1 ABC transporter substrate-binding protein [Streptantibioticus silvisoli]